MTSPNNRAVFSVETLSALGVAILTLSLFLARFGYDYGVSDQEEFVPAAIHASNPTVYANDWFVTSQADQINVRTPTVILVRWTSMIFGMQTTLALFFTLTFTLLAVSLYHISRAFRTNRYLALAAVVVALVMTPQWTMGGNDLAQSMLTPSMMAWSVALAGVALSLNQKFLLSAFVLGLSTYLQPLVSLQVAGVIFIARFVVCWMNKELTLREFGAILVQIIIYVLIAGPFIFGLLLGDTSTAQPDVLFDTLANVRAPHHYLLSSFPIRNIVLFMVLLCAGLTCGILYRGPERNTILVVLGLVLALCISGYIFTELIPSLTTLKLQLFKSTVLAKVFCIVAIGAYFSSITLRQASTISHAVANRFFLICTISGIVIVSLLAFFAQDSLLPGRGRTIDGMASLERWVVQETPIDAVFLIPPSNSRFRIKTERAIVVNFKAFPFQDAEIINWRNRIESVAGEIQRVRNTGQRLTSLDYQYESKNPHQLLELTHQFGAEYVLRRTPIDRAVKSFTLKFISHDGWRVYQVSR